MVNSAAIALEAMSSQPPSWLHVREEESCDMVVIGFLIIFGCVNGEAIRHAQIAQAMQQFHCRAQVRQ
jgi:hypothetical protein